MKTMKIRQGTSVRATTKSKEYHANRMDETMEMVINRSRIKWKRKEAQAHHDRYGSHQFRRTKSDSRTTNPTQTISYQQMEQKNHHHVDGCLPHQQHQSSMKEEYDAIGKYSIVHSTGRPPPPRREYPSGFEKQLRLTDLAREELGLPFDLHADLETIRKRGTPLIPIYRPPDFHREPFDLLFRDLPGDEVANIAKDTLGEVGPSPQEKLDQLFRPASKVMEYIQGHPVLSVVMSYLEQKKAFNFRFIGTSVVSFLAVIFRQHELAQTCGWEPSIQDALNDITGERDFVHNARVRKDYHIQRYELNQEITKAAHNNMDDMRIHYHTKQLIFQLHQEGKINLGEILDLKSHHQMKDLDEALHLHKQDLHFAHNPISAT